ncbi:hypothetical protein [Kamptonema formosum]|nr:hypothetical protein [Oscillatoria sp. PCC 10802]
MDWGCRVFGRIAPDLGLKFGHWTLEIPSSLPAEGVPVPQIL